MKLGSLFDGIAGFPLAASRCGIEPVWASEIEPFPIEVSKRHFPDMLHLGDVTKINGAEIEPVDIITAGSPCQDLSVAGKRAGLEGERSVLFMEFVRIVREMREATNGQYPTFAIWENVPGAFSSNRGQDFRAVLEEIMEAEIPMPYSGKWATSVMVRGNGRSLAWRVLDAQYWGVPQRRKRIFLVADFTGGSAAEILFEQEGVRGDFAESREAWQEVATTARESIEGAGKRSVTYGFDSYNQDAIPELINPIRSASGGDTKPMVAVATTAEGGVGKTSYGVVSKGNGDAFITPERHMSLTSGGGQAGQGYPCVLSSQELVTSFGQAVAYCLQGNMIGRADKNGPQGDGVNEEVSFTLNTTDRHAVAFVDVASTLRAGAGAPKHLSDIKGRLVCQANVVLNDGGQSEKARSMGESVEKSPTLRAGGPVHVAYPIMPIHDKATRSSAGNGLGIGKPGDPAPTLTGGDRHAVAFGPAGQHDVATTTREGAEGAGAISLFDIGDRRRVADENVGVCPTLTTKMGTGGNNVPVFLQPQTFRMKAFGDYADDDTASTVKARDGKDATDLVCAIDCRNLRETEQSGTLQAKSSGGYSLNYQNPVRVGYAVRRLTPTECERLQGFPDKWTEGGSDTARYKALGNSVAVPCVEWIMRRIKEAIEC
jgi:DNA (cytosine-5)-methyltransferase 1